MEQNFGTVGSSLGDDRIFSVEGLRVRKRLSIVTEEWVLVKPKIKENKPQHIRQRHGCSELCRQCPLSQGCCSEDDI